MKPGLDSAAPELPPQSWHAGPLQLRCVRPSHTHESSLFAGMHLAEGGPGLVSLRVATEQSRANWVTLGVKPLPLPPWPGRKRRGRWRGAGGVVNTERTWTLKSVSYFPFSSPPSLPQRPALQEALGLLLTYGDKRHCPASEHTVQGGD